eukprot:SAG11_NODE_897_length_6637_cov_8.510320_2_plen_679_part_00
MSEARAYCAFYKKRLPSEIEWAYSCSGMDNRTYPWGNRRDGSRYPSPWNHTQSDPDDVNAHPSGASPFGVQDCVGNVWQFTTEFEDARTRVSILRGSSRYANAAEAAESYYFPPALELSRHQRYLLMDNSFERAATIGFRCAADMASTVKIDDDDKAATTRVQIKSDDEQDSALHLSDGESDLVATFASQSLSSVAARPATRACAGLLNGGPEFGAKFLKPLRMANYRGVACRTPSAYNAMKAAGATNIMCDVNQNLPPGAQECTVMPSLQNTTTCATSRFSAGNWTPYDTLVTELVRSRIGPGHGSWGISNEPNDGFWPGCKSGCTTPDPAWLEIWNRTVRLIRAADQTAIIVGPSINTFSLEFLTPFVSYAVANGVMPDMLDWHELSPGNGSDIPQHHATMRRWLRENHPTFANISIGHGETIPSTSRLWAGETLGALAGLERAGAAFGIHSNWGESGPGWEPQGHYKQCGFEELVTCNDQPPAGSDATRQPRACYLVYAAYGNTSGVMAPVSRQCNDADAFASYDPGTSGLNGSPTTAWLVVGRYGGLSVRSRSVHVRLSGLPATLVSNGQVTVTIAHIPNKLQLAVPHPLPMGTVRYNVSSSPALALGFDLDLHLTIPNHDVVTARVLRPARVELKSDDLCIVGWAEVYTVAPSDMSVKTWSWLTLLTFCLATD